MKNLIYLLVVVLLFIAGCNENSTTNNKSKTTERTDSLLVTENKPNNLQPQTVPILKDSLDISFVGKTTQELDKYNFHVCFGQMIGEEIAGEKLAVSAYSLQVENCLNGKNKITLEKFKSYYDKGKADFIIKDELLIETKYPQNCYAVVFLNLDNQPKNNYLIEYEDNSKEIITNIHKMWKIDVSVMKFIEIETPINFKCTNPNFNDGI